MDDFREKIKKWVGDRTQGEAAKALGIAQPYLSQILSGERTPRIKTLERLFEKMGEKKSPSPSEPLSISVTWDSAKAGGPPPDDAFLPVPVLDPAHVKLAAGQPLTITRESVVDYALIHRRALGRKNTKGLFCIFVAGNSMTPILRDGAIVCVDTNQKPGETPPRDSVWAVRDGDGPVVKHILFADGALWLISANSAEHPPKKAGAGAEVLGRAMWVWQGL